jgi:hypothetical protein
MEGMVWQFISNSIEWVRKKCSNPLFPIFNAALSGVASMVLNMPTFGAILATVAFYTALVMWLPWKRLKKMGNYNYLISVFITFAIVFPFWNKLLDICDPNNPLKQPLQTAEINIAVIVNSNNNCGTGVRISDCNILLTKKQVKLFQIQTKSIIGCEQIENNKTRYRTTLKLDKMNEAIGKPIYHITKADFAQINLDMIPANSEVAEGLIIFTFNNSVPQKRILISPQTMKDDAIVIPDIQKYLKKGDCL